MLDVHSVEFLLVIWQATQDKSIQYGCTILLYTSPHSLVLSGLRFGHAETTNRSERDGVVGDIRAFLGYDLVWAYAEPSAREVWRPEASRHRVIRCHEIPHNFQRLSTFMSHLLKSKHLSVRECGDLADLEQRDEV